MLTLEFFYKLLKRYVGYQNIIIFPLKGMFNICAYDIVFAVRIFFSKGLKIARIVGAIAPFTLNGDRVMIALF